MSKCKELEEIIAKDGDDKNQILSETHLQSLCFSSLCEIEVRECNKLKSLFPVITVAGLPQLQYLKVRDAPQLTNVFGQDDKASYVNVEKEIVVPNLLELWLKDLPSIVYGGKLCANNQNAEPIEDARKQMYVAIKNLQASCMLLGTEREENVKMHDLIHDVAIQIASSKGFGFVVKAGIGLKEWRGSFESFVGCSVISLIGKIH
ncbi:unnamed protein product [Dovyalis caffra]|uniref:Disease resistance protein At4g27190-like leucine-rich repeats domain-containing protein n=1 Tax=Dovyalis caffra TaxID=77055 RepID=A0AAV1RRY7_9ROSI|nr:unnamed protein product [Dovyalis caffra]